MSITERRNGHLSLRNVIGYRFLPVFAVLFFLFACSGDEPSIQLFVSPNSLNIIVNSGDVQEFVLKGTSSSPVTRFRVTSKLKNTPEKVELDSVFSAPSSNLNFSYYYRTPAFFKDTSIFIYFEITNQNGNNFKVGKQLVLLGNAKPLNETTGWRIFPSGSGNNRNGFSIDSLQYASVGVSDSSRFDFYDPAADSLSNEWISQTGGRFVRFNDFNYSSASKNNLTEAFDAGVKLDKIRNLKTDDIIIFRKLNGKGESLEAVIRITEIREGIPEPYYEFNIKK